MSSKARILYIEDNEYNLYLVKFLLEKYGHQVIQIRKPELGIEAAIEKQPDLILLDIQLPGMDGYTVARTLRTLPNLAMIPIIALTSYAMSGDREKCLEAGCTDYIEKPIDPEKFVSQVEKHLTPCKS